MRVVLDWPNRHANGLFSVKIVIIGAGPGARAEFYQKDRKLRFDKIVTRVS